MSEAAAFGERQEALGPPPEFLDDDIDDDLMCEVCGDVMNQPVMSQCDHGFCSSCIEGFLLLKGAKAKCPACDEPLHGKDTRAPPPSVLAALGSLRVQCPGQHTGAPNDCPWQGLLRDLLSHQGRDGGGDAHNGGNDGNEKLQLLGLTSAEQGAAMAVLDDIQALVAQHCVALEDQLAASQRRVAALERAQAQEQARVVGLELGRGALEERAVQAEAAAAKAQEGAERTRLRAAQERRRTAQALKRAQRAEDQLHSLRKELSEAKSKLKSSTSTLERLQAEFTTLRASHAELLLSPREASPQLLDTAYSTSPDESEATVLSRRGSKEEDAYGAEGGHRRESWDDVHEYMDPDDVAADARADEMASVTDLADDPRPAVRNLVVKVQELQAENAGLWLKLRVRKDALVRTQSELERARADQARAVATPGSSGTASGSPAGATSRASAAERSKAASALAYERAAALATKPGDPAPKPQPAAVTAAQDASMSVKRRSRRFEGDGSSGGGGAPAPPMAQVQARRSSSRGVLSRASTWASNLSARSSARATISPYEATAQIAAAAEAKAAAAAAAAAGGPSPGSATNKLAAKDLTRYVSPIAAGAPSALRASASRVTETPAAPEGMDPELYAYLWILNQRLRTDRLLREQLPIPATADGVKQLITLCSTGVLLCKLLNRMVPGSLEESLIKYQHGVPMNKWNKKANLDLFVAACAKMNVDLGDLNIDLVYQGDMPSILTVLYCIIYAGLKRKIRSRKKDGKFGVVLTRDETSASARRWQPEKILMRWVAAHMSMGSTAQQARAVESLADLSDGEPWIVLLHGVWGDGLCPLSALDNQDPMERGAIISTAVSKLLCPYIPPKSIVESHPRLVFLALGSMYTCSISPSRFSQQP